MAGIGCHGMALGIPQRRTDTITHMGGEGTNWIGQAPFTKEKHVFQNLGDGTYTHSGLLAIRAAGAARVNITYKILYNDAVAMTGGQSAEGGFTVGQIAAQVLAEGAKRVVVVSDEPEKYRPGQFPAIIDIYHRSDLDRVQRELRDVEGLSVLIYDQTCAAEKRRRRKRGLYPDPPKRVFINDLVCEGCGDCSEKSNCVSVKPLETEFGRKREIDQSNCNKDYSCVNGFCPSFVTVENGSLRKIKKQEFALAQDPFAKLPLPEQKSLLQPFSMLVTGIGGTGVITIGALLGMAAHLEGKGCTVLDFTGLAQKNGAVMSHIRLAATPEDLAAVRIGPGGADLLLGCDMVVSASPEAMSRIESGITRAIVNDDLQPTASFVSNTNIDFGTAAMKRSLRQMIGHDGIDFVDATEIATALMGDSIATNLFMLGFALQKGLVPLSLEAIERAIELNGAAVEMNKRALAWGRLAVYNPAEVASVLRPMVRPQQVVKTLDEFIAARSQFLTDYQNAAYAARYREIVEKIGRAEATRTPTRSGLKDAVATYLFKLMAYKDEYEVARLYTDGVFREKLARQFDGDYSVKVHLAPPLFARRDAVTGHLKKRAFGPWVFKAFGILVRMKSLRGTPFDIFGYTEERRAERRLIEDYVALLAEIMRDLTPENHNLAVQLATVPDQIRGFGHIKEKNTVLAKANEAALLEAFRKPGQFASAAE
jgi:indolepyruvate ferredoxin oxidoreductase